MGTYCTGQCSPMLSATSNSMPKPMLLGQIGRIKKCKKKKTNLFIHFSPLLVLRDRWDHHRPQRGTSTRGDVKNISWGMHHNNPQECCGEWGKRGGKRKERRKKKKTEKYAFRKNSKGIPFWHRHTLLWHKGRTLLRQDNQRKGVSSNMLVWLCVNVYWKVVQIKWKSSDNDPVFYVYFILFFLFVFLLLFAHYGADGTHGLGYC